MLLTVLVAWLSVNTGLPSTDVHPRVKFASPTEMLELRVSVSRRDVATGDTVAGDTALAESAYDLQALYDDRSRTIHLSEGWTGATPAESSVLVHELVHHLQNVAQLRYDCAEAREKLAYQAQEKWLELFRTSLAAEFEMDPMTILVRTNCLH